MALTCTYTDPKLGTTSPNAYAVITHERVKYCERSADIVVRIYHSKEHRDLCGENFVREIPFRVSDRERLGVPGGLAGRVFEREGFAIQMAREIGISTAKKVSVKGEDGNVVEQTVENDTWPAELAAWKQAHPTFTELFGSDPDRRKSLYEFLKSTPEFSNWKSA